MSDARWTAIFARWTARLDAAGVRDLPLLAELRVRDAARPDRPPQFDWVPRDEVFAFHVAQQRWFRDLPGSLGPLGDERDVTGRQTMGLLWEHRDNAGELAALLMLADLENWSRSERLARASREAVWAVRQSVEARLGYHPNWHHRAARVIAEGFSWEERLSLRKRPLATAADIVDLLGDEHAARLRRETLAVLLFSAEMDPAVAAELDREQAESRRRLEEMDRRRQEEAERAAAKQAERAAKLARKRAGRGADDVRPSAGHLSALGREELERLVWSMPTAELALELGCSDVAIGKRCKALGVAKPPRGFWAQVKAGRVEHPRGVRGGSGPSGPSARPGCVPTGRRSEMGAGARAAQAGGNRRRAEKPEFDQFGKRVLIPGKERPSEILRGRRRVEPSPEMAEALSEVRGFMEEAGFGLDGEPTVVAGADGAREALAWVGGRLTLRVAEAEGRLSVTFAGPHGAALAEAWRRRTAAGS